MKKQDEQLYNIWDKHWKGSESRESLTFLGRQMFRAKKKILAQAIKDIKPETVIEVGCGLGHTMQVFQEAGLNYVGIDVSRHAVNVCQKKGLKAELRRLEDVTQQYDLVSSDGMLEHFLNFEPHALDLMRISRHYVLLIQPNHSSFWGKTFTYLAQVFRSNENVFEYNYRIGDFIALFQKNGFVIEKNLPIFFDVFRLLLFTRSI